MYRYITEQLLKDVSSCIAFSLQRDEFADIRGAVQLLVFIRMIFEDISFKELFEMVSLKGRTKDKEVFNSFYSFVTKLNVPLLLMGQNQ
jgi:hypothetical protein